MDNTRVLPLRGSFLLFAAAALLFAALAVAPVHAQQTYNLGVLMSMTGDLQAYGVADSNGAKLAVDQINSQGGVLGGTLNMVIGDDQTAPQPGIAAAQQLVSINHVFGIVGALSSGVTIPVAQSVTAPASIVLMSPASTSPVITTLSDNDFLFRTVPSDAFQGVAMADIVQQHGFSNVATLYINNDYGQGLADAFKAAFQKLGGTVSASLAYAPGNASYEGEISKAASNGAQALVLIGYPENGITILRQAISGSYFSKFVFSDGMKAPEIISAIGAQYLNGSIGTVPQALTDTPAAVAFTNAYQQKFGQLPPKPYIDTSYDAAFVLAMALEKAGSPDGTAVRNAIRQIANPPGTTIIPGQWAMAKQLIDAGQKVNYQGASGPIDFDQNGDVSGTYAEWDITNGQIVIAKVFTP